jgi:hypothetical protein
VIILLACRGHTWTLDSMVKGTFGVPTPRIRAMSYDRLFRALTLPRATYLFGDIERLAPWELALAAEHFRLLKRKGCHCLNDPARAMSRVELLGALHEAGINPFSVYRADERPRPSRFPVFLRTENDHRHSSRKLYANQQELEAAFAQRQGRGEPLRGTLVIEQATEPYADGYWAKWGVWRVGDRIVVEHIAVDTNWLVKTGDHEYVTGQIADDEHKAVAENRFAEIAMRAFEIGNIGYGRADIGVVDGRPVIYEINTNPFIARLVPKNSPIRDATRLLARQNLADAFGAVHTKRRGRIVLPLRDKRRWKWWVPGLVGPKRP